MKFVHVVKNIFKDQGSFFFLVLIPKHRRLNLSDVQTIVESVRIYVILLFQKLQAISALFIKGFIHRQEVLQQDKVLQTLLIWTVGNQISELIPFEFSQRC